MMSRVFDALIDVLPKPQLLPKTRVTYDSYVTMRRAEEETKKRYTTQDLDLLEADEAISPKSIVKLSSGVTLSLEDQWAIIGYKGMGKTTLSLNLLGVLRRAWPMVGVNILDSKPEKALAHLQTRVVSPDPPLPARPGEQIVWAPDDNDPEAYELWFERILHQYDSEPDDTPSITYVDELSSIGGNSPQSFPRSFNRIMKQGRSNKKCLILLSQEAAWIPRNVMGQATQLVRLRLVLEPDALRCDAILHGDKERREPASRYGFCHRRLDGPGPARMFTDWHEFLA